MTEICGICVIGGAAIAPDACAWWGGRQIAASIFGVDDAAGFVISGSGADPELAELVRQGRIGARADLDEDGVVIGVRLFRSGNVTATTWHSGLDPALVPWIAQRYFDQFPFARLAAQLVGRNDPARPAGAGEPVQLGLVGAIAEATAKTLVSQILGATGRSIVLTIDSEGGFCEPAMAILDALMDHRQHVETRVIGKAMSAAAVVGMGGDMRTICQFGELMFHAASLTNVSQMRAPALRAVAGQMDQVTGKMIRIVANRSGQPLPKAQSWFTSEHRFDAAAAVKNGICHRVVDVPAAGISARRTSHSNTAMVAAAWRQRMNARFGIGSARR